jgi:hypothetical protein
MGADHKRPVYKKATTAFFPRRNKRRMMGGAVAQTARSMP